MLGLPTVTGVFVLAEDPTLRITTSGVPVCNVRLVAKGRRYNRAADTWEDSGVCWLNGSLWRDYAENVVESARKGDRVYVEGSLEYRTFDVDGEERHAYELHIEEFSMNLRFRKVLHSDGRGGKVTREGAADPPADDWSGYQSEWTP